MMGVGEIIIIGGVIVLIFGATRIPKLGKSIGEGIRALKKGLNEDPEEETEAGPDEAETDNSKDSDSN